MVQVACPGCLTANRVPQERLGEQPKCGKCGTPLLGGVPHDLREDQFDAFVARTQLPVLADFWAPWCGPCRAMAPHFESAARQLQSSFLFVKINTEEAPALAARIGIRAIPTLVLFKDGAEAKRVSGALDATSLIQWVS